MPAVVRLRARVPAERAPAEREPRVIPRRPRPVAPGSVVLLAAIVLLVALIVGGGAGQSPPASGAAAVVPGDALAYIHVSTDPARVADHHASALAQRFPDYSLASVAVLTRLDAIL